MMLRIEFSRELLRSLRKLLMKAQKMALLRIDERKSSLTNTRTIQLESNKQNARKKRRKNKRSKKWRKEKSFPLSLRCLWITLQVYQTYQKWNIVAILTSAFLFITTSFAQLYGNYLLKHWRQMKNRRGKLLACYRC